MLLISNIEEMKACYSRLNINSSFDSFASFVEDAQVRYLTPLIGQSAVDFLTSWYANYDAQNPDPGEEYLIPLLGKVQKVLTFYSLLDSAPTMVVDMGDNGLTEKTNNDTTPTRLFVLEKLVDYLSDTADAAAEDLLLYLETAQELYPFWNESPERQEARTLYISSGQMINQYVKLAEPRRFFLNMVQSIKRTEEILIQEILGTELNNLLKSELATDSLTSENDILVSRIKPVVAYYSFIDTISDMAVAVGNNGLRIINNNDRISARGDSAALQTQGIMTKYRANAVTYEGLLRKFLNDNYADYPLFPVPIIDTDPGHRSKFPDNNLRKSFRF
jgi:hypothetical protein